MKSKKTLIINCVWMDVNQWICAFRCFFSCSPMRCELLTERETTIVSRMVFFMQFCTILYDPWPVWWLRGPIGVRLLAQQTSRHISHLIRATACLSRCSGSSYGDRDRLWGGVVFVIGEMLPALTHRLCYSELSQRHGKLRTSSTIPRSCNRHVVVSTSGRTNASNTISRDGNHLRKQTRHPTERCDWLRAPIAYSGATGV